MESPISSPWLTVDEAAQYARRHRNTVQAALTRGELEGNQTKRGGRWLIHRDAVDAWTRGEKAEVKVPTLTRGRRSA